jgi:hypothetical protein
MLKLRIILSTYLYTPSKNRISASTEKNERLVEALKNAGYTVKSHLIHTKYTRIEKCNCARTVKEERLVEALEQVADTAEGHLDGARVSDHVVYIQHCSAVRRDAFNCHSLDL